MSSYECKQFTEWYLLAKEVYPFTMVMVVILCLSVLPTVVLNVSILTAIVRTPTLHTPSNILICNLAAANLGLALVGIPTEVASKLLELYNNDYDIICSMTIVSYSLCGLFNGSSYLTLVLATLDRYLTLILHLRYQMVVTNGRIIIACCLSWIPPLLSMFLLLVEGNAHYITVSIMILLSLVVIVFCYSQIFTVIRRHHNQIASQVAPTPSSPNTVFPYRKSVLSLFYVVCCQFALLTPYMISMIVFTSQGVTVTNLQFWRVSACILFFNSFVNPLIICMKYGELRAAIKDTSSSCWKTF